MEPKKKKVIDLTVIDQLLQSGVDAIALVEDPAIEINFLAFKKELFVKPSAGESEGDFIGRCMSAIEGEFPDQDQRLAVCYSYWEGGFQEEAMSCPVPTQNLEINTRNRNAAIESDWIDYGPLNVDEPGGYWEHLAEHWGTTVEAAKKSTCGNCAAFDISPRMKDCMPGPTSDGDGELGYCHMHHFKCHSARSCYTWAKGGPIVDDKISMAWQSKSDFGSKENLEVVVNAPPYVDQTGESNKKKKKPILEARPVLMSADEELLLAYFSQVGMSTDEYNLQFANADLVPWQEGDIMPADGAGGRTYYKYVGPPAERDFCRQMLFLDRLYTFEEIDTASGFAVNPGFGEGGGATYDIWKYKGGPNCKHRWQKFYAKPNGEIVNKGPATGKAGTPMYDQPNHGYVMSKMYFGEEGDKRILVGPAMVPDMEIPRYDKKNKEVYYVAFSKDAVAKIAEKFMREQSTHNTNQDHDMQKPADTYIFESWIVEDPATDKANTVYGYDVPAGTWMVKMRVNSDAVWTRVKSGELKGFSVEGNFVTEEELAEIEAAGLLSRISEIIA